MTRPKWRPSKLLTDPLSPDIETRIGDPAKGAKVPRCGSCGQPSLPHSPVHEYALFLDGLAAGRYRLCIKCHQPDTFDPRSAPDPLTA